MKTKRYFKMKSIITIVVLLLSLLSACGSEPNETKPVVQPNRAESKSTSLGEYSAQSLGVRLVSNAIAATRGDSIVQQIPNQISASVFSPELEDASNSDMNHTTVNEKGIIFHDKIYLADPISIHPDWRRSWFFVWSENAFDCPIRSAQFTHRIYNSQNQIYGNLSPSPVWHDIENHRWFISIADLFQKQTHLAGYEPSLDDFQVLDLELNLESGRQVRLDIRFQVTAPLPRLQLTDQAVIQPESSTSLKSMLAQFAHKGWVIKTERVTNPSLRPYYLWLRTSASPSKSKALELRTQLHHKTYQARPTEPPAGPKDEPYLSIAQGQVRKVTWTRLRLPPTSPSDSSLVPEGGPLVEEKILTPNAWVQFVVQPLETVEISWWAMPQPGVISCFLPLPETVHFNWSVPGRPIEIPRSDTSNFLSAVFLPYMVPGPPILKTESRQQSWNYVGGKLTGEWGREIRIAFPFTALDQVNAAFREGEISQEVKSIASDTLNAQVFHGQPVSSLRPFHCQGVFENE